MPFISKLSNQSIHLLIYQTRPHRQKKNYSTHFPNAHKHAILPAPIPFSSVGPCTKGPSLNSNLISDLSLSLSQHRSPCNLRLRKSYWRGLGGWWADTGMDIDLKKAGKKWRGMCLGAFWERHEQEAEQQRWRRADCLFPSHHPLNSENFIGKSWRELCIGPAGRSDRLFCLLVRLSAQEPPNSCPKYSIFTAGRLALHLLCQGAGLGCNSWLTGLNLASLKVMMPGRKPVAIFLFFSWSPHKRS